MFIPPMPLPPTEILHGTIAVWRNAWAYADETIEVIENAVEGSGGAIRWTPAEIGNKVLDKNTRSNYHLNLTSAGRENSAMRTLNNNYYEMTYACSTWYANHFGIENGVHFSETFSVLKYQTGQEFKAHYDGNSSTKRVISPILYLNDEYEGGELEFVNFDEKIKPAKGDFYIFPANFAYRHIAHPVKEGTKYAIVTWLHDVQ
jgi:hypothetical protein